MATLSNSLVAVYFMFLTYLSPSQDMHFLMTSSTHHYYQLHNSAKWDVSLHLRALMSLPHKTTTRYCAASNYLQVIYGTSRFHYPFEPLMQPRRTLDPPMPISFDSHMRHLAVPLSQHSPKPFDAVIYIYTHGSHPTSYLPILRFP